MVRPTLGLLLLAAACAGGGARSGPAAAPPGAASTAATVSVPAAGALGELDFQVTGSAACQQHFATGMLAMHSFEYETAHEEFAAARSADPGCAMAAWGDAMAYDHPIWHERDLEAGRAALASVTAEDRLTPRERAYLAAARALYASDDEKAAGAAWLDAARQMRADHPDDDEVALQYALALLRNYAYKVQNVREQMEAGSIALAVLARRPHHPGAAHYAIHAFDSREHAILALPAAQVYARIAPAAGHAQHMPSHTFVHLGMWREAVPSNERAIAAAMDWAKAHGEGASAYDWHAYSWLVAAHLELGHHRTAQQLVDEARALLLGMPQEDSAGMRSDYANMVAIYVLHTGRWDEAEALLAPVLAPLPDEGKEGKGPVACAVHAPGGGGDVRPPHGLMARVTAHTVLSEVAIRRGDRRAAEAHVADVAGVLKQMAAWKGMFPPEHAVRMKLWDDLTRARAAAGPKSTPAARAKVLAAIEALGNAARGVQLAGPTWLPTTDELAAELLLADGKPAEALARYGRDLDLHAAHSLALLGAARAAAAAGDAARAREHYQALAELWRDADADLPALAEVKGGAAAAAPRAAATR